MPSNARQPILIAGVPRSGSSWVGKILSRAPGVSYCREPDNEKTGAVAYVLKQGLHRFPFLPPASDSPSYTLLWRLVFEDRFPLAEKRMGALAGRLLRDPYRLEYEIGVKCGLMHLDFFRHTCGAEAANLPQVRWDADSVTDALGTALGDAPASGTGPHRVVCKSVHCLLALPWLEAHFAPRIVVLLRHPLNVIASYLKLRLGDSVRNVLPAPGLEPAPGARPLYGDPRSPVRPMAEQLALFYAFLEREGARHPHWTFAEHETLCLDPEAGFRALFEGSGLEWTPQVERALRDSNRAGKGFETKRIASEEPEKWKGALEPADVREIRSVFRARGLDRWT